MTPWFAAGAGFVLAAALWIYAPHTELRFPSASSPDEVPCTVTQCTEGGGGGQAATNNPGQRISQEAGHGRNARDDVAGQHSAISGLTFTFSVPWQQNGSFQAIISVRGKNVPASWRLEFTMPGTHIRYVIGAEWRPMRTDDGGTAFSTQRQSGGGGQGNGQDNGAYGQGFGVGRSAGRDVVSFLVMGSGSAGTPATCVFNGSSCSFS